MTTLRALRRFGADARWLSVLAALLLLVVVLALPGCPPAESAAGEVVVFVALDEEYSRPLLEQFGTDTGIIVKIETDDELSKTTGMVTEILANREAQVADVFWNNEIAQTIRLKIAGVTEAYDSPSAADIPEDFRDPERHWNGFAARARVILVNTEVLPDVSAWPSSILDLTDEQWRGRAGLAKPLFGTTATHAGALFTSWGDERGQQFFRDVLANETVICSSNGDVMRRVSSGALAWGFTDTDDANVAIVNGDPVAIVYPDQEAHAGNPAAPGEAIGTLLIPNTICLIKGGPNPDNARKLIDYILSRDVEAKLAQARSVQIPVRDGIPPPEGARPAADIVRFGADYRAIAEHFEDHQNWLRQHFIAGE